MALNTSISQPTIIHQKFSFMNKPASNLTLSYTTVQFQIGIGVREYIFKKLK